MKLKISNFYSQRDPQWAGKFLGFNTALPYTIGNYGCLITCFSMYINKRPDEINEMLKSLNGFQDGGLFLWSKSPILGLIQNYLSPRYDDAVSSQGITKIKELLDQGFPLICEIDFNPNTLVEEMHYVLLNGYDGDRVFACDPWTGTQIDLDLYGGPSRTIIQFRAYDKTLPKDDGTDLQTQLNQVREERDRNWNWFVQVCEALGVGANVDAAVNEAKKLVGNDDALVQKDKQIQEANTQISDLESKIGILQRDHEQLTHEVTIQAETIQDQDRQIKDLLNSVNELKSQLTVPVLTGWRRWLYDHLIKW